jgi:hypothetical protein
MGDFLYICFMKEITKDTCLYMHTRKSDGRIFYIGIGDKDRPTDKNGRNNHWYNTVNKYDYDVTILVEGLTWEEACGFEIKMIAFYGRRKPNPNNPNYGCLVNMTDGGQGAKGRIVSEETRETIRQKNIAVWTDEKKQQMSDDRRKDQEVYINQLKVIYGDSYDYRLIEYMGHMSKVTLICNEHDKFDQWTGHLLNGIGCQKCSMEEQVKKMMKPLHEFVSQADVVHGGKYDYSKVVYNGVKNKVEIVCHDHGSFFMTPDNHINGGNGCKECGKIKVSELQKKIKRGDRSKSKIVLDINTGVFYDCALDVAELYGVNNSTMTSWLNGKRTNKTSFRYV